MDPECGKMSPNEKTMKDLDRFILKIELKSKEDEIFSLQLNRLISVNTNEYLESETLRRYELTKTIFPKDFTYHNYHNIYRKLINNCFLVNSEFDKTIGFALYEMNSIILKHSCLPNAFVDFDGNFLNLKSRLNIKDRGQVTISFVDKSLSYHVRNKELFQKFGFSCTCFACSEFTRLRDNLN